jgi:phosphoglycolate phosphatase-like HAD superfamily hydrolase
MIDCVIFDIDGVLADARHRLHYLEGSKKQWNKFYEAMDKDPPFNSMITVIRSMSTFAELEVIIITGRPNNFRFETGKWLRDQFILYRKLYMRKEGDHRLGTLVKKELLAQARLDGFNPVLAFEDTPDTVAMYRSEGILCLQAAYNELPK